MGERNALTPAAQRPDALAAFKVEKVFSPCVSPYWVAHLVSPKGRHFLALAAYWPLDRSVATVADQALVMEKGEEHDSLFYALLSPERVTSIDDLAATLLAVQPSMSDFLWADHYGPPMPPDPLYDDRWPKVLADPKDRQQDRTFIKQPLGLWLAVPPLVVMAAAFFGWRIVVWSGFYSGGYEAIVGQSPTAWAAMPSILWFLFGAYLLPIYAFSRMHIVFCGVLGISHRGAVYRSSFCSKDLDIGGGDFGASLLTTPLNFVAWALGAVCVIQWLYFPDSFIDGNPAYQCVFVLAQAMSRLLPDGWLEILGRDAHLSESASVALIWGALALLVSPAIARQVKNLGALAYYRSTRKTRPAWAVVIPVAVTLALTFAISGALYLAT